MRIRATVEQAELENPAELIHLTTHESLSELFDFEALFICDDPDLDLDAMIWASARVVLEDLATGQAVQLSGIVEEAEYQSTRAQRSVYRLRLRPRLNGLAYRVRSRIFQEMDVEKIVKTVFKDAGVPDDAVKWKLSRKYRKREYCVQYQESELSFVRRLLEEEGIFFFFRHGDDGDILVIGDAPDVLAQEGETPVLPWQPSGQDVGVADGIFRTELAHNAFSARDWNWEKPAEPLEVVLPGGSYPRSEYPGGYGATGDGGKLYEDRREAFLAEQDVLEGTTTALGLEVAGHFELTEAQPDALCGDYRVNALERTFETYEVSGGEELANAYRVQFRAVPGETPFRPLRKTPRPRIFGKENAVVVGPSGEEIHVDEFGRVKVHFYWDREGKMDDTASCWMRVQQNNTAASMLLPRVGWEVSVGFIDGNPDRPVALQKLYNQETMPPYALPDNQSQMSLQSSSSPGGGGTNELRMSDGAGGMELFIHASRNMNTEVGHDLLEDVTVDSKAEVGEKLFTKVGVDEKLSVGANQKLTITNEWTEMITGDKTVSVSGMDDWGITKNYGQSVEGAWTEKVGGVMNVLANEVTEHFNATYERNVGAAHAFNTATDLIEAVQGKKTELVGAAKAELISKGKDEQIKVAKALTAGVFVTKAGADVAYSAKAALAINVGGPWAEKCGEAFSVTGEVLRITAAGGALLKAGGTKLDAKGGTLKVKASSFGAKGGLELKLKGKINYKP